MEAIVAATRNNADAYGKLDELGTLEAAKRADLLVVTGNPAEDVAVLYDGDNINVVMKDGAVESTDEEHKTHYRVREEQPANRA
jgi:imidazolonepropionase-like amidohydrolase